MHDNTVRRRAGAWLTAAAALLLAVVDARGIQVNLTASWPSSTHYPLLEASEYLAETGAGSFWKFVDALEADVGRIETLAKEENVDELSQLAVDTAENVAPGSRNLLELMISTRTYSVKVEMFRQLGLDSAFRTCGADATTWAVVSSQSHCAETVACTLEELKTALNAPAPTTDATASCAASSKNDFEMEVDHKFPSPVPAKRTVVVYGLVGTKSFYRFHRQLAPLAKVSKIQYILRHYPRDSILPTLLQGYGVALDIKNMEYKTIDDSKRSSVDEADASDDEDDDDTEEDDEDEEDVDGFIFSVMLKQHKEIESELKKFRDSLVNQHDEGGDIKAWHLKDLGIAAARDILDAKNSLRRLQVLAQDFPKHAKKLAFSRKPLSTELRQQLQEQRLEVTQNGLLNKFLVNGIRIDAMQRSFNIFDLMKIVKDEWTLGKQLANLPLPSEDVEKMLQAIRDAGSSQATVRIHIRGPSDGDAPLYLNNIETDAGTQQWHSDVGHLRRPSWNLIFLRKNMYEFVVVMDPMTSSGLASLQQIAFLRMRGAPLQWGLLISSKELLASKGNDRDALIASWKKAEPTEKATAWHFAKILLLARSKDKVANDNSGRMASAFIDGVVEEGGALTLKQLVQCYVDASGGSFSQSKNEKEAWNVLRGEFYDDEVMAMTTLIERKHLPLDSNLFNGVLRKGTDVQSEIMAHFSRDQNLYVEMARNDLLTNDMDLVEELLGAEETYASFFSIFNQKDDDDSSTGKPLPNLFHDTDGKWETTLLKQIKYFHAPGSINLPKKETLLFVANLNDPVEAAHVLEGVKAALEDSEKALRVGVVHRLGSEPYNGVGDLAFGMIRQLGHSDNEQHGKLVLDALRCVVKRKTLVDAKKKLLGIAEKLEQDDVVKRVLKLLQDAPPFSTQDAKEMDALAGGFHHGRALLYLNGQSVELPDASITGDDVQALTGFDLKYRSQAVAKAFIHKSEKLTPEEANERSHQIVKTCGLVDAYKRADRFSSPDFSESEGVVRIDGDSNLKITAFLDPLSEAAQRTSSLLIMLQKQLNAAIELVLVPQTDYSEFPLQRFYRFLFDKKPAHATHVEFQRLPIKPILTLKMDTTEAWNVQVLRTADDLDNLRVDPDNVADIRAMKSAEFELKSLLVYGQCRDATNNMYTPPNGLQLVLDRELGNVHLHRDTLVMKNLGYFQLQATPGVWSLHLARGRALELFEIFDEDNNVPVEDVDVRVYDFKSRLTQLIVRKRKGKEYENLLEPEKKGKKGKRGDVEPIDDGAGLLGSYWSSVMSLFSSKGEDSKKVVTADSTLDEDGSSVQLTADGKPRTGETIHVFSLATGHLYERFLKIMMSSVLKRTNNPVTFWLLENFLSPDFKNSIPALRERFGMDIRLVTYKWPNWLRQQTQKQRIIWGYKILFLDVLFPLGVQKIIYVDADQVVRADLKELWEMDLQGAPYGYTPFCDSRNVGFQFWRQGYWKDHLRGKPYHISALYVVDLALFRQMAAGDMLRAVYDQLSADPNSLSNLDQDLPNYTQHQIKIFSLPQEWLWCESWCSDESKGNAKTIDLCNNPKHKEPKLDMAKRVISGPEFQESWLELDDEIKQAELAYRQAQASSSSAAA
ncbi:TPA: hypothetical protein N0F65_002489 [Lagenidium giganteum]|uniref:UDP-glucose:glycoprotein glucosyltransferase n=1 Tax=Lagenidium giganteum TaxID=4803 RepID=A0AAV2YX23_9STRA|nr:TPA: hypothetical protein N0F65_002489 [Lagenidium giganteum]